MATKEDKHNREECSAVVDARATSAAAIREQCGRKLKAWVSYKIAICMFPNLNACTCMDFGFFFTLIYNIKGGVHHIERRQGIIIKNKITKARRRRSRQQYAV